MSRPVRVVLLHAYSARNSGDGLLVDLSVDLLREAFGSASQVSIIAADPASFPNHSLVYPAPVLADAGALRLASAAAGVLPTSLNPTLADLRDLLRQADVIVAVGGGYLRARTFMEALKLEAGHLLQMRAARAAGKPTVYLPQSIGPMASHPWFGRRLRDMLRSFSAVCVRDDRSTAFLAGNANTCRVPDLAVLEFGRQADALLKRIKPTQAPLRHVALVLRKPPAWNEQQRQRYQASTRALIDRLRMTCRLTFAVQSTGRGNDDSAYYRTLGIETTRTLKSVLAEDTPDAVVSVRLHGALESILHGVPAFHLSYERKGFGAYADLGVDDWVANAADFDASRVVDTLLAAEASTRFWRATREGLANLQLQRAKLISTLRAALASPVS